MTNGTDYLDKNPFWYRFTCFEAGTLNFTITPVNFGDDYDWQLYDVTGLDPNEVFTNRDIIVTGNWSASPGPTGTTLSGVSFIQCASDPTISDAPRFARSPNLVAGHEYLLLVSHFDGSTQSGYDLTFEGGTAVITDPQPPHMELVTPNCDGTRLTVKLNKPMNCTSLTLSGSEFAITTAPEVKVVSATALACNSGFSLNELILILNDTLSQGQHKLLINNGDDGNTLTDNCGRAITAMEEINFQFSPPPVTFIDSVGNPGCMPTTLTLYLSDNVQCRTVAANGSDFIINGSLPVVITAAITENCISGLTNRIVLQLSEPIFTAGRFTISLQQGAEGTNILNECALQLQQRELVFVTVDTVNASFTRIHSAGPACRFDTLTVAHNGTHDVNSWNWTLNGVSNLSGITNKFLLPESSSNIVGLIVSNGICRDTTINTIVIQPAIKAVFNLPGEVCPEDKLVINNTSIGAVDKWNWNFDELGYSTLREPPPLQFIQDNRGRSYVFQLTVFNSTRVCADTLRLPLKIMNNCYIGVPTGFTPNGDGLNDFFSPNNALKADNFLFNVFNRWGQMVFSSRNWREKWDGKFKGIDQSSGVYVWYLSYTNRDTGQKVFQKGTVTLIR